LENKKFFAFFDLIFIEMRDRPKGKMGRRLHKMGDEVKSLSNRADDAESSVMRLKHLQTRSVNGWESCMDRVQYARQSLDQLMQKQDHFTSSCEKKEIRGYAELDNFETVPEKWQAQREHAKEAEQQLRIIQEEMERKKREREAEREAENAWVTSDDVYNQMLNYRGPTLVDDDEEEEEEVEEEEAEEEEVAEDEEAEEVEEEEVEGEEEQGEVEQEEEVVEEDGDDAVAEEEVVEAETEEIVESTENETEAETAEEPTEAATEEPTATEEILEGEPETEAPSEEVVDAEE